MSATFQTNCFACGHFFDVTYSKIGQIVECPECSQRFLGTQSSQLSPIIRHTSLEEFQNDDESAFNLKAVDATNRIDSRVVIALGTLGVTGVGLMIALFCYAITR